MALRRTPAAGAGTVAVLLACACAGPALERREYERPAMGTSFRIVLFARDGARADAAAEAAFARIEQLEETLSDWSPSSELSRLSRSSLPVRGPAGPVPVGADLFAVLAEAQRMAERTEGAFDVTVGPYVRLWRRSFRQLELPQAERLDRAASSVGRQHLRLDPRARSAELLAADMRLDLGGIAKGYAVDQALRVLEDAGVARALVDGGGDVAAGEPPPGRAGWRVALRTGAPAAATAIELARGAAASSGDAFRFATIDGVRYSHIVDPRSGWALRTPIAATVLAADGMTADALASALCVLGPEAGLALVETLSGVEARLVLGTGEGVRTFDSTGFAARIRSGVERTGP